MSEDDAVVIGSGPNGLAAAVALAQGGAKVLVVEARDQLGGGTRTAELTLPGFAHDVCAGVHPMGILSPFFRTLPLDQHGLRWMQSSASVAHPLDSGEAVLLHKSLDETCAALKVDGSTYRDLVAPFLEHPHQLIGDSLAPFRIPRHPFLLTRFALRALRSAHGLARRFRSEPARALLAGCAAHSILPLDRALTAGVALLFLITAHVESWPVAEGGSQAVANALTSFFKSLGGRTQTGLSIRSLADLPPARAYLFDTDPTQLANIAGAVLPARYQRRLRNYRYGPGVFKLDWALEGSVPWKDPRCLMATTVHLGGTFEEIAAGEAAVWRGEHPRRPYVLCAQQSEHDQSRAPAGRQTFWGYVHVPPGSTVDQTEVIEDQVERFAPGFRKRILARHKSNAVDLQNYNANYVGGAITGGVADLYQLFTRPVARINPYTTPHPRIFICSASTPPGGGVHGMCGYYAAQAVLRRLDRLRAGPL